MIIDDQDAHHGREFGGAAEACIYG
jgi:hypothetical protein